jgi:segregation and condensation protein A
MPSEARIITSVENVPESAPVLVATRLVESAAPTKTTKDESDSPFAVSVTDVYEGPLDLLLDLIRKQDIDIYDIPIARITAQYLAYVEKIR